MTSNVLTDFSTDPLEAGKGGEGGDFQITNADFVAAVFPLLPEGAFAAVCSKSGDPLPGRMARQPRRPGSRQSLCREQQLHRVCEFLPRR
jgi:hypothetical protein